MRSDAARNRALLLASARELFATQGLEVTLDEIARHAGVGTGTAYRHFANKREIAQAIFAEDLEELAVRVETILQGEDPRQGLLDFLNHIAEQHAGNRGLYQAFQGLSGAERKLSAVEEALAQDLTLIGERLVTGITALFVLAQEAGIIRPDAAPSDLIVILLMLGKAYDLTGAQHPELWRRYLALMFDGLCCRGEVLPAAALTMDDFRDLVSKKHQEAARKAPTPPHTSDVARVTVS